MNDGAWLKWFGLVAAGGLLIVAANALIPAAKPVKVSAEAANRLIDASHFVLGVTEWLLPKDSGLPKIAMVGSRVLVATSAGRLFYADAAEPFIRPVAGVSGRPVSSAALTDLALVIPTDMDIFAAADIQMHQGFGVGDILVERRADGAHDIYASFGKMVSADCMVLRVAVAEGFDRAGAPAAWRTLFDSQPCFPVVWPADRIAGRMRVHDGGLYVTVGYNHDDDRYFAAANPAMENPQRDDNSYGKIMRIDLATGAARIVSKGHRNPQGLHIDGDGAIFETEHGPRGGDELNRIVEGGNYGWPAVTYGVKYESHAWSIAAAQNRHDGYVKPVYAWVPSIGVSQIVRLDDEGFGAWRGDLLIASLRARSLHRVHMEDDRVMLSEPIKIDHRIRDLALDGATIYMSTDDGRLVRAILLPEP